MTCPISGCVIFVPGPLRICATHYKLVPRPQQEALAHYARTRKGGPSHVGAFERAVESVTKILVARSSGQTDAVKLPTSLPYRDD